jgi:hypothetical protein
MNGRCVVNWSAALRVRGVLRALQARKHKPIRRRRFSIRVWVNYGISDTQRERIPLWLCFYWLRVCVYVVHYLYPPLPAAAVLFR